MSDQSASPADPLTDGETWKGGAIQRPHLYPHMTPEQADFVRRWYEPQFPVMSVDDQGVSLSMDDTLRVREQSIYAAALITDCTPFPEDDAEKVVEIAKRFEKFIRSGQ